MPKPTVRTMRQPPVIVPSVIIVAQARITQSWTSKLLYVAAEKQHHGDDAHALLGVVRAVRERKHGRAEPLELSQIVVENRACALHQKSHHPVYPKPNPETDDGGENQRQQDLGDTCQVTVG